MPSLIFVGCSNPEFMWFLYNFLDFSVFVVWFFSNIFVVLAPIYHNFPFPISKPLFLFSKYFFADLDSKNENDG